MKTNQISIEKYLDKKFDSSSYNCFNFVRDVWLELTGIDLGDQTPAEAGVEEYNRRALTVANTLTALDGPECPSIVLLQRARLEPHIGVYHKGKVLHLTKRGAYYMALDQVTPGYPKVSFYK
jgi:hypothetical protein